MGLLSHLWHVINREVIAGSLQWLETTQIPGNYASIPTPRPHFSLCLPFPCPSHTRNKVRWWQKKTKTNQCPESCWVQSVTSLSLVGKCRVTEQCLVSQHSLTLLAFIPQPCFQEAELLSLPGFQAASTESSLWCHFHARHGTPCPCWGSTSALFQGTPQNRTKRGLARICTQHLFF